MKKKSEMLTTRMHTVFTRAQAAEYLQISERTLDTKLVKTGKIRKFLAGDRTVRFLKTDIDKFINQQLGRKTAVEEGNI